MMRARLQLLVFSSAVLCISSVMAATVSGRITTPEGQAISDAVVFVQSPERLQRPGADTPSAVMDQVNKTFVPGVLPIVAGTRVRFPNRDQIHHHVYSFSRTKSFELPLYKGEEVPAVLFDKPGAVQIGCNIHDWMSAVILVLPTSYFDVTDEDGRFTLDLPAGPYTLAAWHARSRTPQGAALRMIEVGGPAPEVSFQLSLAPERPRAAQRGARRSP